MQAMPLHGVRVVTLAPNVPGPVAAARLRDLGATVTKVEPSRGDALARYAPAWYAALHQGITVEQLDLTAPEQRSALDRYLRNADALLTSSRPASLAKLCLDWLNLHAAHPRLVHVAIVGRASPRTNDAGHDLTYQAEAGLVEPPQLPRTLLADLAGAERAVSTVVALLLARERSGKAAYAEVSLAQAAHDFAAPLRHGLTAPGGLLGGGLPHYGLYRVRDGWVAVANVEPRFRERFAHVLGLQHADHAAFAAVLAERTAAEWETWGARHDLPVVAVSARP